MRLAIISDIHSNLEALEAALEDIKNQNIQIIYCAGDLVGYAASPNEVIDLLQQRKVKCVMGNHDYTCINTNEIKKMVGNAGNAIHYTKKVITADNFSFLKNLPFNINENGIYLTHGIPPDFFDEYIYMQSAHALKLAFKSFHTQVAFVGHSHLFEIYQLTASGQIRGPGFRQNKFELEPRSRYMISAGSIGQPRDDDREAGYLIYDTEIQQVTKRTFQYNVELAIEKIKIAGLPESNGTRLLKER